MLADERNHIRWTRNGGQTGVEDQFCDSRDRLDFASRIFHCSGYRKSVSLWSSRWNSATARLKLLSELHHKCLSAIAGTAAAGNASQFYGISVIHGQLFARPDLSPATERQVARGPFWLQVGLAAMVDTKAYTPKR